jgi:hypothetical protein
MTGNGNRPFAQPCAGLRLRAAKRNGSSAIGTDVLILHKDESPSIIKCRMYSTLDGYQSLEGSRKYNE